MMLSAALPQVKAEESSTESALEELSSEESSELSESTEEVAEESDLQVALNEAIELFKAGYPEAELDEIEVELRKEDYKIKIHGFQGTNEYELEFSVDPVEITKSEEEEDDDDQDEALILADLITIDQASEIALKEAAGGTITDWKLDTDDGKTVWEIKVEDAAVENTADSDDDDDDDNEFKVVIDATTSEVLKTEFDD